MPVPSLGADEVGRHTLERVVGINLEVVEQALVTRADKFRAFDGLYDRVLDVAEYGFAQRLGDDQRLPSDSQ